MRVTGNMLTSNFMRNLHSNLKRMELQQSRLSTGRAFTRAGENPVGVTRSLQARADVSRTEQYRNNVRDAATWLTQSETTLFEINDLIARAYELSVKAASGTKTPQDRQAIANEAEQLQHQLVLAANASFSGRYLFGGHRTTHTPFEISGTPGSSTLIYNGHDMAALNDPALSGLRGQNIQYEVGFNIHMSVSFTGIDLMGAGEGNLYALFDRFTALLKEGTDQGGLNQVINDFQSQQDRVLALIAEAGGKQNRLEFMEKRFEKDYHNLIAVKSGIEDADYPKAVMEFKMAEIVYQSSLAAGARIIQLTLLDFLR